MVILGPHARDSTFKCSHIRSPLGAPSYQVPTIRFPPSGPGAKWAQRWRRRWGVSHARIPAARPVFAEGEVTKKAAFWDWVNLFLLSYFCGPFWGHFGSPFGGKVFDNVVRFLVPILGTILVPILGGRKEEYIVKAPILGPFFGSHFGDTLFLFF